MSPENPANEIKSLTRIVLRPLGSALPIGFFSFGTGVILLSALEMRWIPPQDAHNIPLVVLGFVAPLELLGCVLAFLSRDTAAATALGIFAFSWVPQALVMNGQASQPSSALGILLMMVAFAVAALAVTAYGSKPLLSLILAVAFVRSGCASLVEFGLASLALPTAVSGFVLGAVSVYGGTAFLIEDAKQSDILPLFRRGPAEAAMHGGLDEQVIKMPNKPGIRRQL